MEHSLSAKERKYPRKLILGNETPRKIFFNQKIFYEIKKSTGILVDLSV